MAKNAVDQSKASKDSKGKKPNKVVKFLKDLKSESKKIVWPSKKTVLNNTGIVLATMVAVGVFIWGFDLGLTALLKFIIGLAS